MKLSKLFMVVAALFGLSGVILGAMGAHALAKVLGPDQLDSFETAVRFQMYHGLFLFALAILFQKNPDKLLRWVAYTMIIGTILFSGSIYLLVLTPAKLGLVTPLGGTILIVGWALFLFWGIRWKSGQ